MNWLLSKFFPVRRSNHLQAMDFLRGERINKLAAPKNMKDSFMMGSAGMVAGKLESK